MEVDVYKNLHRSCWSIRNRKTGKVVEHTTEALVLDAKFVVQPAGRRRVLQEGRKNVHAFVRGTLATKEQVTQKEEKFYLITPYLVKYNPYKADHFFYRYPENRIDKADLVELSREGVTAWNKG